MKKLLFAISIVIVLFLYGCDDQQPLEIDKIYYNDSEYIKINEGIETDYILGDQTPNIESFFSFYYVEDIETYEIISDIETGKEVFDTIGTFLVTCTTTLTNGHKFDTTVELIVNPLPTIYDYMMINTSLQRNFMIGDDVPDFYDYVTILNEDRIQRFEIISPIESAQFDTYGHFDISIEITTIEGYQFAKSYQFYVDDGFNFVNGWIERFQSQLDILGNGEKSYDSYNEITYYNGSIEHNYIYNGKYRARLENYYGLLLMQSEYIFDDFHETAEIYAYVNHDQIIFYENSYNTDYNWLTTEFTWEEYFDSIYIYGDVEVVDLLTGVERPKTVVELDDTYIIGIPVSEENFSFNIALEIIDAMIIFGLYDGTNDEIFTEMMDNIDLIQLTVELTKENFYLRSIELDYTELLNHLISNNSDIINLSTGYKYFSKAIYREDNFHNNQILEINDEVYFGDITDTTYHINIYNYIDLHAVRDEENKMIYQVVRGTNQLEALNYESFEYRRITLDNTINRIKMFDDKLFVLHQSQDASTDYLIRGTSDIVVIDKNTLEIINTVVVDYRVQDFYFDGDHTIYVYNETTYEFAFASYDLITGEKINEYRVLKVRSSPIYLQDENMIVFGEDIDANSSMIRYISLDNGLISDKVDILQVTDLFSLKYVGDHYFIVTNDDKEWQILEIHGVDAVEKTEMVNSIPSTYLINTELDLIISRDRNSIVARDFDLNIIWAINNPIDKSNFIFEDGYIKWNVFNDSYYDTDASATNTVVVYTPINSRYNTDFPPYSIEDYEYTLVEGTVDLTTPGTYTQTFTYHLPHEDETFIVVCTYVVYEKVLID
ncbi:MAG: hypothetical protein K9L02_00200 [Acholeplasmataceae bacterium]|nr:hypothetical protein [Acholeplasmataceae bacterium]